MPDYLAVPEHRRDRAIHEKARLARRGELRWIRSYLDDLDEDALFGEPAAVRFLDLAIVHLAARQGWLVLYDSRAIAGRFGLRGREVKAALERLVELRRFELIHAERPGDKPGEIQPSLFPGVLPASLRDTSGVAPASSRHTPGVPAASPSPTEPSGAEAESASQPLARARESRAEERREVPSRATSKEDDALPACLLEHGWNGRQVAAAIQDPDRARAWLAYAEREPGLTNLGGYVWARFAIPGTWPNGKRPLTGEERIQRLEAFTRNVLVEYPRQTALEELDERLVIFPPALRPSVRDRLVAVLDSQEPSLD